MANSASLSVSGRILTLIQDPTSGTLTQDVSLQANPSSAITITASGGPVSVERIIIDEKYPFTDLGTNQVKSRYSLSRQIEADETVTVSVDAGFISDGSSSTGAISDLPVSPSFWATGVEKLLSPTSRIVFVDGDNGDDTLAAAVNSGNGYYTLADFPTPESETTAPQAYATLNAAYANCPDGNNCILFRRGQTYDGATHYFGPNVLIGERTGADVNSPFIFGAYGNPADSIPRFTASGSGGSNGARPVNIASTQSKLVYRNLDISANETIGGVCIFMLATAEGDYGRFLFHGCKIKNFNPRVSTSGNGLRYRKDIGFVWCNFDNANADSGMDSSDDWDDSTYRELEFWRCAFTNIGNLSSGLKHPIYAKSVSDLVVQGSWFYNCGGAPTKLDTVWGAEISYNIMSRCTSIANIESNGDPAANTPSDRSEDNITTEYPYARTSGTDAGAFSRWCCVHSNIVSNMISEAANGAGIGKFGTTYDSRFDNNVIIIDVNKISYGIHFVANGGSNDGGYTRDSYRPKARNNTIIIEPSTTKKYGLIIQNPDTDSFGVTNNNSKGHHDLDVSRNVFVIQESQTNTHYGVAMNGTRWDVAVGAGRTDGSITNNLFYSDDGVETGFYNDFDNTYDTIAEFEAAVSVAAGNIANNVFQNPSMNDIGYKLSDYANADFGGSLGVMSDAMVSDILSQNIRSGLNFDTIANTIIEANLSRVSGNYGVVNWVTSSGNGGNSGNGYGSGNGPWGVTASLTDAPKFIEKVRRNSMILTKRGWEQSLAGTDIEKGLTEIVVAGNFGIPSASNQEPVITHQTSAEISGISGGAIIPIIVRVNDPDKVMSGDSVTVSSTLNLPDGLSVTKFTVDSPHEMFMIAGIPTSSGSGTASIVFEDGNGGSVTLNIPFNISS